MRSRPSIVARLINRVSLCGCLVAYCMAVVGGQPVPTAADSEAVQQSSRKLVDAYNAGRAKDIAAMFMPDGEAIDEAGNVYHGREQIEQVFQRFFEKFPGAKMTTDSSAVRLLGPGLAVEDGRRKVVTQDGVGKAATRFTLVHAKRDGQWLVASAREFAADESPTPHERLQSLAWLAGEWVDEDAESVVAMNCRWSDDKNYLLVEFTVNRQGKPVMKTSQRIGWDPLHQRVRSWTFDSDGGYGDAQWTAIPSGWVLKSTAVLPDGRTGSATLFVEPTDRDKFAMRGFDRIVGADRNDDYEVVIVRKPPAPASASAVSPK
ncbi:MAG: SgcJ/EcaC family oxidoreductase [Planctomycetota bacterium]